MNDVFFMQDIVVLAKVFHADIYGSFVRDVVKKAKNLNIRIDSYMLNSFLTILNTKYTLEQLDDLVINGVNIPSYALTPKYFDNNIEVIINLAVMSKNMFRMSFLDFDVNLLTENQTKLYLRYIPPSIKYIPDQIGFVRERIASKSFCTIQSDLAVPDIADVIDNAVKLTCNGWTMDDILHTKPTWVVGKWQSFAAMKHKKKQTYDQYIRMMECNECSLCHEKFKDDTNKIVINTACNHNFHWMCLSKWVRDFGKSCCPYCRSEMFSA